MINNILETVSLKGKGVSEEEVRKRNKILVIDELMGSGKTMDAIEIMKFFNVTGQKYIYVTPYIKEIKRVVDAVGIESLRTPQITNQYVSTLNYIDVERGPENAASNELQNINEYNEKTRMFDFINLAMDGKNIAISHQLFLLIEESYSALFFDYSLILDEVVEVVSSHIIKPFDFRNFIAIEDLIQYDPVSRKVVSYMENYNEDFYKKSIDFCRRGNVFVEGTALISIFPIAIFNSFRNVQILTYMFEGSILSAYFKMYGLEYTLLKNNEIERAQLKRLKSCLKIYNGTKNFSSRHKSNLLSHSSFEDLPTLYKLQIKKGYTNLCRTQFGTKSDQNAYTTYKDQKGNLAGVRYSKNFIPSNARATNEFANIKSIGYFLNKYLNPGIANFFSFNGVRIDESRWATSELIQLLWRGCIRNGEDMNVYIPSYRMRHFLYDFLDGKYIDSCNNPN